jgi:putative flippase GtrA
MVLKKILIRHYPLLQQLIRFGIIGVCAASTHFLLLVFWVEVGKLQPLIANIIAFLIAFQVSYWGHRGWTFSGTTTTHRVALPRLFLVCGVGFIANEGLYYIFLEILDLPYQLALIIVLAILPIANFILGKLWVFR